MRTSFDKVNAIQFRSLHRRQLSVNMRLDTQTPRMQHTTLARTDPAGRTTHGVKQLGRHVSHFHAGTIPQRTPGHLFNLAHSQEQICLTPETRATVLALKAYTRGEMRLTLHTIKAGMATAVSLWMAALACVMGCTQPVLASSQQIVDASATQRNSSDHGWPDLMADMESCQHSGSNSPAPPNDKKPNTAVSCCPLEITITPKWSAPTPGAASPPDIALPPEFRFQPTRHSSLVELSQPIPHSGRDTLLETHLLRI
jgi:hypothetical protein